MKLAIKRIGTHSLPLPSYAHATDAGIDLRWTGEVKEKRDGWALYGTGFAYAIPPGFEGQVRGRSGLATRGVEYYVGTIDSGYAGEVMLLAKFPSLDAPIKPGDRIAQLVIAPIVNATIEEVQELGASDRGAAGFGSTGLT